MYDECGPPVLPAGDDVDEGPPDIGDCDGDECEIGLGPAVPGGGG